MAEEDEYLAYVESRKVEETKKKMKGDAGYQDWLMTKLEEPNVLARVGRGFMDMGQGVKQAFIRVTEGEEAEAAYTKQVNDDIALYERGRGEDPGFDFARLGGQAAAAAPAGVGMMGRTMMGKAAIGGGIGAAEGGMMFSPEGAFSGSKAVNIAAGGIGGAALGVAVPAAGNAIKSAYGYLAKKFGNRAASSTASAINDAMGSIGVKLEDMSADTVANITRSVDESLQAGVDPASAARKAVMESVGMTGDAAPTRAQTSMDAGMWTKEQELSKLEGGEALNQRYQNQTGRFRERTNEMDSSIGGMAPDDVATAQSVSDNLLKQWRTSQADISRLYRAAGKQAEGAETTLDSFGGKIQELVKLGKDETVPQLNQAMRMFERNAITDDGLIPVNANRVEEMKKALQEGWDTMDGGQRMVVRELVESLKDDMDSMGEPFKQARIAAEKRFNYFGDKDGLVRRVIDGRTQSKTFISTKILGGEPADISALRVVLNETDPQAWMDIRGRTFDYFMRKAYQGNPGSETAEFSGKMLGKAMNNRDSVMAEIFMPHEIDVLQNLARTGEWMKSARPNSNVNYSNTASVILRSMQQVGKVLPIQRMTEGGQRAGRNVSARAAMSQMPNAPAPQMSPTLGGQTFEDMMKGAGIPVLPEFTDERR